MNLAISVCVAALLVLFSMSGCASMKNVGIVYTHPTKQSAAFKTDLGRCLEQSSLYYPKDHLLNHLLMELRDKEHFPSVASAICLEALGWQPALEFIAGASHNVAELENVFNDCVSAQEGTIKPLFSGVSLLNIQATAVGTLAQNDIWDCLDLHGWMVRSKQPWTSPESDPVVRIFPIPFENGNNYVSYRPVAGKLQQNTQRISWAITCSLFSNHNTWEEVNELILKLNAERLEGHDDWRLPNRKEMEGLLHIVALHASKVPLEDLNQDGFPYFKNGVYWTSTPAEGDFYWGCNLAERQFVVMGTTAAFQGLVLLVRRTEW